MKEINENFSFTNEEVKEFEEAFNLHVRCDNTGEEKIPRHWMKFTIFSPPRSGHIYKGFECSCGYEFYLRSN